jgi:hypothetical protein
MTFPFFFIIAHIEINFIIRIAFLNVVYYKTLNIRLDLYLLVINPLKPTRGLDVLSISPFLMIDDKHLEFFNN